MDKTNKSNGILRFVSALRVLASKKIIKFFLEALAVLFCFIALLALLILWRLQSHTIDISFAKPMILSSLNHDESGYQIDFDNLVLAWPDISAPIKLETTNLSLLSGNTEIFHVDRAQIHVDGKPLIQGIVALDKIILLRPKAHIIRDENNRFTINIADEDDRHNVSDTENHNDTNFAKDIVNLLLLGEDEAVKLNKNFGYMDRFEIQDAEIIVSDYRTHMTWFLPSINAALYRWEKGINANLALSLAPDLSDNKNYIDAELSFERDTDKIETKTNIKNFDLTILSRYINILSPLRAHDAIVNGRIITTFNTDFTLDNSVIDLKVPEVKINLPEEYAQTKSVSDIDISGFYDAIHEKFQFDLLSLNLNGSKFSGKIYGVSKEEVYDIKARLNTDELSLDFFKHYWPNSLREETAASWLTEKLSSGVFSAVKLDGDVKYNPETADITYQDIKLDFDFNDMDIDYRAPLLPVTDAQGHGQMTTENISINVNEAKLDKMDLSNGHVLLDEIFVSGAGKAHITANLDGPLSSVFEYIAREPIGLAERFDFDINDVKGDTKLDLKLDFPTVKNLLASQVNVNAKAKIDKAFLPNTVKGHALTGGPFDVTYGDGKVHLKGHGKLIDRPLTLDWTRYIDESAHKYHSIVEAKFKADLTIREAFGVSLDDYIKGTPAVNLTYKQGKKGRAEITTDIDLTPAIFMVKPFQYEKKANVKGKASAKIILKNEQVQEVRNLNITTNQARLRGGKIKFGKVGKEWDVTAVDLSKASLDKNKFDLKIRRDKPELMRIELEASELDLLPFLSFGKEEQDKKSKTKKGKGKNTKQASLPPTPRIEVYARAASLRTSEKDRYIKNAKIYVKLSPDETLKQLELDARAGSGDIYLRYKPNKDGKLEFRLEADDAGAVLKAFSLYDYIQGGKIIIYGEPIKSGHPNDIEGIAQIKDFRVIDAPDLARLLHAMTLPGLEDLLNAEGLRFDRLESNIKWQRLPSGLVFSLSDGRTSGGSLGLTFEGHVYQSKKAIDLRGTIVPLSPINKLVSKIPLLGQVISGGKHQGIFAATYSMSGPADDPKVSINPLSVLAPGILRRILFEGGSMDEPEK